MSLDRKLTRWRDAGLIDETTRARIEAFEHAERKPVVLYALAVLGAGTVALGIVSVIAANWDEIPGGVKLACDLVLGAGLAVATFFAVERRRTLATEVLVTLFYGFTLASLALVGQVYQLGTPTWQALVVWSVATLPLVLIGRSRYLAALVCTGLATTHGFALEALFDHLEHGARLDRAAAQNIMAAVAFASPLVYVPLARVPWLLRERPEFAHTLSAFAFAAVLLGGFGLQFVWYDHVWSADTLSWALVITALCTLALAAALPRLYPELPVRGRRALAAILGYGWLTLAIGTAVPHESHELVGALLQLGWLVLCAWAALQVARLRLFNLLTALIAVRILVIYFEVFGSLLDTGLGLITGGALTLLMAWIWRRKTRDLGQRLSGRPAPASDAGGGHVA
jgi:uncharacterized membrane protein